MNIIRIAGELDDFVIKMGGSIMSGKDIIESSSCHNKGGYSPFICDAGERWTDKLIMSVNDGEKAFYVFEDSRYLVIDSSPNDEIFLMFKNFGVKIVTDGELVVLYSGIKDDEMCAYDFTKYHSHSSHH